MIARLSAVLVLFSCSLLNATEPIKLHAGPLSVIFEPDNAMLRYVTIGGHKILQGITAPVRDQHWGTVPPNVKNVRLQDTGDAFAISFDVSCRHGEIDFFWRGKITGSSDGKVTFTFDGEARTTFLRNRIGFCVLHGPEAAGKPCVVEMVDGKSLRGTFPVSISPHQPFKNMRMITHEVSKGLWAKVRMIGDTFEMEDQRNWTDASFKTYCTPLELPLPVRIPAGTTVSQKIEISVQGVETLDIQPGDTGGNLILRVSEDSGTVKPIPGIGLQVSSQVNSLSDSEISRLRDLHLDHLRVDLTPSDANASNVLRRASLQAEQLGTTLHVGLHLGENANQDLLALTSALKEIRPPSLWVLVSADERQLQVTRDVLQPMAPEAKLGRGEDTNFTELNRNRPNPSNIDFVSYGLNPQVHAFDNLSMVETLAIQGDTVRTARQFVGDLPLVISPITLRKQLVDQPPTAGQLPANVDPRQLSSFAAAWTLGSIKYLAEAGVDRLTYYETVGWLGIMESQSGAPLAQRFPSRPGQLFPIYYVLRELSEFSAGRVRETASTDPMSVIGLAVEKGDRHRLIVANLTSVEQTADIRGFGNRVVVRTIVSDDLPGTSDGRQDPRTIKSQQTESDWEGLVLELPPYGIAALDSR